MSTVSPNANPSQVRVDKTDLQHAYVSGVNAMPMVDDCVLDLGTTSLEIPPELSVSQITPETSAQIGVMFRHTHRLHMTWPTAKRIAVLMTKMVQTYEANMGEIKLDSSHRVAHQEPATVGA